MVKITLKSIQIFVRENKIIYQKDGALPHYSLNERQWLDERMQGRWIGRRVTKFNSTEFLPIGIRQAEVVYQKS